MRACREELPLKIEVAAQAAQWEELGGYRRNSLPGIELAAALDKGGPEAAWTLVRGWMAEGVNQPPQRTARPLSLLPARPWASGTPSHKRSLPDVERQAVSPAPEPPKQHVPRDVEHDAALLRMVGPEVREMFQRVRARAEQGAFLAALQMLVDDPQSPAAHALWGPIAACYGRRVGRL